MTEEKNFFYKLPCEKVCYYFIITLMILVPLGEFVTEFFDMPFITQPVIIAAYGIFGGIMLLGHIMECAEEKRFYPTDVFCITLIIFVVISLVFSKSFANSIGGFDYDEWITHFFCYFSLMFAGTMINDNKLRKNVILVFIAVAVFHSLIGFLQTFGIAIHECYQGPEYHTPRRVVYGLTQNCNFFAGLGSLFTAVTTGAFIFSKNIKHSVLLLIASGFCFYTNLCTGTRLSWVGSAAVIAFYAICLIVLKAKKTDSGFLNSALRKYLIILGVFAVLFIYLFFATDYLNSSINEFGKDFTTSTFEEMGTRRGYIWMYALESVEKYWPTGVGLDNFRAVFSLNPKWDAEMLSNGKAHSEYLHYLATQGVFAGANYVLMIIYCACTGVKNVISAKSSETRAITCIFLGMFAAYAAQAFFNSSLINVVIYFWIAIGLTVPRTSQEPVTLYKRKGKTHNQKTVVEI